MIDNSNNFDILNLSVKEADFLCQHSPLVCAGKYRFLDRRRTRAFLLEENMPTGIYKRTKKHKEILRRAMLGKHHTLATKQKISKSLLGHIGFFKGKHLSKQARLKIGLSKLKEKNYNWKGGKYLNRGYLLIYAPGHPFNHKKYVPEHRLVMEYKIKRYLKPTEIVHHIDGNKVNNRIENLLLCKNPEEHKKIHLKKEEQNGILV